MEEAADMSLQLANELHSRFATANLRPEFAKLYSQYTLLQANRHGLHSWQASESEDRLSDAMRLVDAAFVERESPGFDWQNAMRRAAELLEWLSPPELNTNELPIRFLAAAAYQLAGYPARATGLLNESLASGTESRILRALLKADFPELLELITDYWSANLPESSMPQQSTFDGDNSTAMSDVHNEVTRETVKALGVFCIEMRWGNELRLTKSIAKLASISRVLLYGGDTYSWLLAKLCSEVVIGYVGSSLRNSVKDISASLNTSGQQAIERYVRQNYLSKKSLVWPSQVEGIERLKKPLSFALCTPTGSGKTTVAEIAILQGLFLETLSEQNLHAPLVIYMVPSRALASEVEAKLSGVLGYLGEPPITVTGLYGGTEWGPTDAWLTLDHPTVLICTYEKAEALIRFLGPLFIRRVRLVIVDEAHSVQFNNIDASLQSGDNRELRLEALGMRLFSYLDPARSRVVALSAVAAGAEKAIAQWVGGREDASPTKVLYRSTRQLIGRLECYANGDFRIEFDLLDGARLQFAKPQAVSDTPYINNPFPPCPTVDLQKFSGPDTKLRPYLFWSAIHFAQREISGQHQTTLIFVPTKKLLGGFAEDFLYLLNDAWKDARQPVFFEEPTDPQKKRLWTRCLEACRDYFTQASREYRLLEKGIVLHHGSMPGLLARLLVEVIQQRIVHIVLATSTLSEGVNLPFDLVLVPSLMRGNKPLSTREFTNLIGRAGRPGYGTEGRALVLLRQSSPTQAAQERRRIQSARDAYLEIVADVASISSGSEFSTDTSSPLTRLLQLLYEKWAEITKLPQADDFYRWLELTKPLEERANSSEGELISLLDSLDGLLLAAIVELEELAPGEIELADLELRLKQIWQRTYSRYASAQQKTLEITFLTRGKALKTEIYPDKTQRMQLYRTSLPPRGGSQLLSAYPDIRAHLLKGNSYALWNAATRFAYILQLAQQLRQVSNFGNQDNDTTWHNILHWWLAPKSAPKKPSVTEVTQWYSIINTQFTYQLNWGIGSIVAIAINEVHHGRILETSLEEWPDTGLPWIVYWLKELIIWGTLDPVAAFALAHRKAETRFFAEDLAAHYYAEQDDELSDNDILSPTRIREWLSQKVVNTALESARSPRPEIIKVSLSRNFSQASKNTWRVLPVVIQNMMSWIDPAGFELATSQIPSWWDPHYLNDFDFFLNSSLSAVTSEPYLPL